MPDPELVPPSVAVPKTSADDPRLGHLLGQEADVASARVVLIGFPSDEGVRVNGGRPGAARGPDALRQQLYKLTPDARLPDAFTDLLRHTVDVGNVKVSGRVEEDQQRLGRALAPHLARGAVPVVLGGGHETAFGHFLGYAEAQRSVQILNWDAHADVRPLKQGRAHSGSPFRQALDHSSGTCQGYTVAGLHPASTAKAHLDFLEARSATFFWNDALDRTRVNAIYDGISDDSDAPCLATFDLDAVDQTHAPGVSAPNADGLAKRLWLHAAYRAGRCPHITSIDVSELNPRVDTDDRTARLAALTVWHFLRGRSEQ